MPGCGMRLSDATLGPGYVDTDQAHGPRAVISSAPASSLTSSGTSWARRDWMTTYSAKAPWIGGVA